MSTVPLVPIFIIVHDRVEVLKKTIASIEEQIKTPFQIILHDVASTYPDCIKYLKEMREKGYPVHRHPENDHRSVLLTVEKYLRAHPACNYYVITDPDIELDAVRGDILEFYIWMINKFGKHLAVGPMLRIDDIPNHYPKKKVAVERHQKYFWSRPSKTVKWKGEPTRYQNSAIDSTFHMVHRSNKKKFPRAGIRCYSPYAARHLDWYIDPNKMTPDQEYYSKSSSSIAHWGRNIRSPNVK